MISGLSKILIFFKTVAGRKHANRNEIQIKESGKTSTLLGPDEFLLKPTGISLTNLMELKEDIKDWRVTKVKAKKGEWRHINV